MVFVRIDRFEGGFARGSVPYQRVVVLVAQHISQLAQFAFQCFYAVGLLDFEARQSGELERNVEQGARHDNGLRQVGSRDEVVVESRQHATLLLERNGWHSVIVGALGETGLHAHQRVYVLDDGVALLRSVHESFKHQLRLGVVRKRHHLIPIG